MSLDIRASVPRRGGRLLTGRRHDTEACVALSVPEAYRTDFDTLRRYISTEMDAIGDDTLTREVEVLDILSDESAIEQTRGSGSRPG